MTATKTKRCFSSPPGPEAEVTVVDDRLYSGEAAAADWGWSAVGAGGAWAGAGEQEAWAAVSTGAQERVDTAPSLARDPHPPPPTPPPQPDR